MTMKKKMGSKLSEGVRKVKSQREPAAVSSPKATPTAKPATQPTSDKGANKPAAPRATTQTGSRLNKPLGRRVWPD